MGPEGSNLLQVESHSAISTPVALNVFHPPVVNSIDPTVAYCGGHAVVTVRGSWFPWKPDCLLGSDRSHPVSISENVLICSFDTTHGPSTKSVGLDYGVGVDYYFSLLIKHREVVGLHPSSGPVLGGTQVYWETEAEFSVGTAACVFSSASSSS